MNKPPPLRGLPGSSMLPPIETPAEPLPKSKKRSKRTTGDRFTVLNTFVDCSIARLTKTELATWFILYRDTREGTAQTSQADIARRAGVSDRSVRTAIKGLENAGLLDVVYRGSLNGGPSRYRVNPLRKPAS